MLGVNVMAEITDIKGVGAKKAEDLKKFGFDTVEKVANATLEELSQLPGVGKVTADKLRRAAKELLSQPSEPEKKVEPKKKVKAEVTKKPKAEPTKKKVETEPKKTKAVSKKKVETKKKVEIEPKKTKAVSKKKIETKKKTEAKVIKTKRTGKKKETGEKAKETIATGTYGVVRSIIHDSYGRSKNKSVLIKIYNTNASISSFIGRKVAVQIPNSKISYTGKITKVHGKHNSAEKVVVARFNKGVSPHILEAKATFK